MLSAVAVVLVIMVSVGGSHYSTNAAVVINSNELVFHALNRTTCDLNDNYWNLIRWFFERVTFIEVTEITCNRLHNSIFANNIIRELGLSKLILLIMHVNVFVKPFVFPNSSYRDYTEGKNFQC